MLWRHTVDRLRVDQRCSLWAIPIGHYHPTDAEIFILYNRFRHVR